jgi:hypothetical protein
VTVALSGTDDRAGAVNHTATTGTDGSYCFSNLRPGTYTLTETQPAGYQDGQESPGSAGGAAGADQITGITLVMGQVASDYNFGEQNPPLTAVVFADSFAFGPANFARPQDLAILTKQLFLGNPGQATVDPATLAQATFVDGVYRNLLKRPADAGGLIYWMQALQAGATRGQIVHSIWVSPEHRGLQVDHFYTTFLRRPADSARTYWVTLLMNGVSEVEMARMFLLTAEYQATHADNTSFINGLYSDVLGRAADQAGMAYWTQALQNGATRDAVARQILTSAEAYTKILECNYAHFLRRSLDANGRQFWLSVLQSGQASPGTVSEMILASDEYFRLATIASQS